MTNVHRVLGIVNGTTNFILSAMESGRSYADALAEAQRLGYAEADPTDDVAGFDAAAKIGDPRHGRVRLARPARLGRGGGDRGRHRRSTSQAARALDMHVKLIGRATLVDDRVDVRVGPAFVDAHHPLAAVEGAFNAVMLQGDAIREITLEGPGRRRSGDRLRSRGGHGLDRRHDRHGLPPERPGLALARASARPAISRPRTTCGSRSRIGPASSPTSRRSWRPRASRSRGSCSSPATATPCSTSSPTRRRRVVSTPRSRRSAPSPSRAARRARCRSSRVAASKSSAGRRGRVSRSPWRMRAGMTTRTDRPLPRSASRQRDDAGRLAR